MGKRRAITLLLAAIFLAGCNGGGGGNSSGSSQKQETKQAQRQGNGNQQTGPYLNRPATPLIDTLPAGKPPDPNGTGAPKETSRPARKGGNSECAPR